MLTNSQILLHLIDRYLHGYTSTDLLYTRMKQQLYKLIQSKLAKESIEAKLTPLIGEFNDLNASLYFELAAEYLRKVKHKRPTTQDLQRVLHYDN